MGSCTGWPRMACSSAFHASVAHFTRTGYALTPCMASRSPTSGAGPSSTTDCENAVMPLRARARALRRPGPVFWLLSGQLIMFVGVAALFPIAPLYVARRGGVSLAIALFVAGPLIANTLVQVPAGRL